jgi:anti-anti-sigma regulatory factor
MLRISDGMADGPTVTLRLEGQISGLWVDELRKTANSYMGNGHTLILDATNVTFADREGVGLLRELQRRAVVLQGCSAFLLEQLKRTDAN